MNLCREQQQTELPLTVAGDVRGMIGEWSSWQRRVSVLFNGGKYEPCPRKPTADSASALKVALELYNRRVDSQWVLIFTPL